MFSHYNIQKVDYIAQKLRETQTTQIILRFIQMHLPKPNLYCIACKKQQKAVAFMRIQEGAISNKW